MGEFQMLAALNSSVRQEKYARLSLKHQNEPMPSF